MSNKQDELIELQTEHEKVYIEMDRQRQKDNKKFEEQKRQTEKQKLINLKNEPISQRIENARRNFEALSRCNNRDEDVQKDIAKALRANIEVMSEVDKIK